MEMVIIVLAICLTAMIGVVALIELVKAMVIIDTVEGSIEAAEKMMKLEKNGSML